MSNGSTTPATESLVPNGSNRDAIPSSVSGRIVRPPASERPTAANPVTLFTLTALCAITGIAAYAAKVHGHSIFALLYVVSYITGGWAPVKEVIGAVREKRLDVNLLMVLAAAGAASIGEWGEGATLLFLFSLSGALEKYTLERTARSIEALIELRPDTALVLRNGTEERVPIERIVVGDLVRVMPGERLGIDGTIKDGTTSIDQSTITGESMPVSKKSGDEVFAGTLNQRGSIVVIVERTANETTLAKIVRTVREAQDEKADTEQFVQRWQKPYVICVLIGSLTIALVHYFLPDPTLAHGKIIPTALYHAMVLLVAASPCAVVIATPAATLAGITRAARSGVLFKGGAYLEKLADVSVVALDKTGTITKGEPAVVAVWSNEFGQCAAADGKGYSAQCVKLLQLAASVEQRSEHPLAQAVVAEARRAGIELLQEVTEFDSHVGQGVHAHIGGRWVGVGRPELFSSHRRIIPQALLDQAQKMRAAGQTVLIVFEERGICGAIGVADQIRPEAAGVLKKLKAMGVKHVAILTGDHARVAEAVAKEVGADTVRAGLLPDQKVTEIARIHRHVGKVAMIGDGVNDAPALAVADVGIAMGGAGTDVALETADVVLMKNDLEGVATAIWLGHRTRAAVSRGLIFAFSVIAVLVVSSLLNVLPLWLAVVFHEGSTVCTVFSGLYLLVERGPES